jgi:hypothetical protein
MCEAWGLYRVQKDQYTITLSIWAGLEGKCSMLKPRIETVVNNEVDTTYSMRLFCEEQTSRIYPKYTRVTLFLKLQLKYVLIVRLVYSESLKVITCDTNISRDKSSGAKSAH